MRGLKSHWKLKNRLTIDFAETLNFRKVSKIIARRSKVDSYNLTQDEKIELVTKHKKLAIGVIVVAIVAVFP